MNKLIVIPPILIAHRGYSGRYPENTLSSYRAAYQHGARYMELDLQLTRDRVPMLQHDESLLRMAGVDWDIRDTRLKRVKTLRAAYAERFGNQYTDNKFTTFRKYCKWLKRHPDVTTFVEIKQESIDRFGITLFVDKVYRRIVSAGVESQCVLISFNDEVVEYCRRISSMKSGWVLPGWNDNNKAILDQLQPDFLFCDKKIFPAGDQQIWRGNWQWAIYNLDDVRSAIEMANRGIPMLETNEIGILMADYGLSNRE